MQVFDLDALDSTPAAASDASCVIFPGAEVQGEGRSKKAAEEAAAHEALALLAACPGALDVGKPYEPSIWATLTRVLSDRVRTSTSDSICKPMLRTHVPPLAGLSDPWVTIHAYRAADVPLVALCAMQQHVR